MERNAPELNKYDTSEFYIVLSILLYSNYWLTLKSFFVNKLLCNNHWGTKKIFSEKFLTRKKFNLRILANSNSQSIVVLLCLYKEWRFRSKFYFPRQGTTSYIPIFRDVWDLYPCFSLWSTHAEWYVCL